MFDRSKAALELLVGLAQGGFGIGIEVARQIGHGEEEIAGLGGRILASAGGNVGLDLAGFFPDFGKHREWVVPVEADLTGFLLKL